MISRKFVEVVPLFRRLSGLCALIVNSIFFFNNSNNNAMGDMLPPPPEGGGKPQVATSAAFTGRMCAGTRAMEHNRPNSLFEDPLAGHLAGNQGNQNPMGDWILIPRTRFGDDFLVRKYFGPEQVRQLVLLGAGMDSRSYRRFCRDGGKGPEEGNLVGLPELRVFEVDQPTNFEVKEPLLREAERQSGASSLLTVQSRTPVPVDFNDPNISWATELVRLGFDPAVPTVWLPEGLVYYLPERKMLELFEDVGRLSAPGSGVFHDGVSTAQVRSGVQVWGEPFLTGSDDYGGLWRNAGFDKPFVRSIDSVRVDRNGRRLAVGNQEIRGGESRGKVMVFFVQAEKSSKQEL